MKTTIITVAACAAIIGGMGFGYKGIANQADPNFSKHTPSVQTERGGGQALLGAVLIVGGMITHVVNSHKVAASTATPSTPSPVVPNTADQASNTLLQVKQQIHDDWQRKIAALSAEATKQIDQVDKLLAQRKGGP